MGADFEKQVFVKATIGGKIIGSVRGYLSEETCFIGRLIVHPDFQNRGIGTRLLNEIEQIFIQARRFELFTGNKSERNLYLYQKQGYEPFKTEMTAREVRLVFLEKYKPLVECDAILFDLDGVLIDSTICIARHWREWAHQHGLDLAAIMRVAHGIRTVETMRLVAPHLDAEEEAGRFTAVEVVDTEGVVAIEGASQLLSRLPQDVWAIVTSGSRELAMARLRRAGLPIPRTLVAADDVKQGKPTPEPYLVAAKRLGIAPSRCVVVEDAPAGIEAAHAAGMQVIAMTTTHSRDELPDQGWVIDRLSALYVAAGEGEGRRLVIQIE
jgi:sugar-phosphatase